MLMVVQTRIGGLHFVGAARAEFPPRPNPFGGAAQREQKKELSLDAAIHLITGSKGAQVSSTVICNCLLISSAFWKGPHTRSSCCGMKPISARQLIVANTSHPGKFLQPS